MPSKKRQFSVEKKLKILEEERQPGTTVAEVLRRHQVDPTTFYRWEQQAKDGMRDALARDRRRTETAGKDQEIEQLRAELAKKSRIIAEVVEENLDLKKKLCHRSTREALEDKDLRNLSHARELIGRWVTHYNEKRLHASLQYLPPAEYFSGAPERRLSERHEKLERARQQRAVINRQRHDRAAA
jgi:transposase